MCGIFVYVKRGLMSENDKEKIRDYFNKIKHRGPDHTDDLLEEKINSIYMGFHRLAIIDPSEKSNHILRDESGKIKMVCNGEIYNYEYLKNKYKIKCITGSDCEVILYLYKNYRTRFEEKLRELDGVFSFVIYDGTNDVLVMSRDRFGVRPLFEGNSDNDICYASEGKGVVIKNAKQFKPGVMKIVNLSDFEDIKEIDWNPVRLYGMTNLNMPYTKAQTLVKELLIESVRKRLISDRPIGFLVSGGLDSSLVAAIANNLLGKKITTFSIGLENSPDLLYARQVAEYLHTDHHEIIIKTNDIIEALSHVIYHNETFDITTTRASIPMYLISKYIQENTDIKVIFSGEGADELFGGYLYFHKAPNYEEFQSETHRLLSDLYKYDVLRSDRTTAAWGLEIRVPFLDADLVDIVSRLDPAHKMPSEPRIEKSILRNAFDGFLPDSVLYRQKEAFSDGVGYNSVAALKYFASKNYDSDLKPDCNLPKTPEAILYYNIFKKYFGERQNMFTEYYWMPKWYENINDPSATVLDNHVSQIKC